MITLLRTDSSHVDFLRLIDALDQYLAIQDGDEHEFYDQFNKPDAIKHVVIAYEKGFAIGCGALKKLDPHTMEVKRMYTKPDYRGRKIATHILLELEAWARELSIERCILETGKRQPEAIALYHKSGYQIIQNYGPYKNVKNSICFEKVF
ncbi:GNAT family N-acetyltransferase [Zhouia amylolytica]|uniref:Putative acetyltransferase n=1 Tax=Zhouia amylolytica AD3 TaxID=1286632 RepID=W2UQT8_9FLAO|nr:GNAT family N-acetyltransferase [Zhouia amylolytica]ETN95692.1 putative acetyltransferase [Zhouia amylolytica AD3]MCQ0112141.1 GNAT family N-acetyltransferase [Zhouia amylolytica]